MTHSTAIDSERIKRILPWLIAFGLFMETLDISILNTAVPAMARSLALNPLTLKAALTSYTLSLAIFIPISGWVSDRFGTHRVFCGAIGIFMLGSLVCGLAINLHWLIGARVVQGIGGALMVPVGRSVLIRTFPKADMLRAMSFVAIPALVGPVIGPFLGGFIADYFHWRFIFFINLPIGLVGLYFAYQYMPNYTSAKPIALDWIGFILFCSGVSGLSYALELLGEHHLPLSTVLLICAGSATLLLIYTVYALRHKHPIINVRLFRSRTFTIAITGGWITRLGLGGVPFILPLFYQLGFGLSPTQSGLLVMPQALGVLGMKTIASKLLHRFGYQFTLFSNTIMVGILLCFLSMVGPHTPIWLITILIFLLGLGSSLQFTSINTLTYADIASEKASMGTSIASIAQQLSTSFGVALAAVLIGLFIPTGTTTAASQIILFSAFNKTFLVLGLLTILSTAIFHQLHPEDGNTMLKRGSDI
jgi:EmrB/QacA subfamily drug resistance transporter